ncbi:MAG: hypothetical protein IJ319_04880 [Bacteroidaceae bacterium]|nr:hypothetical protein [Bacteroidaceae bacterium]
MKKPTFLLLLVLSLLFVSCSNDDENIPFDIVSEFNKIPKDELQGWDDGLYSADMYMLASYDEINNHIRYYISDKRNIGLYILLNEERKIIEIGNQNYSANVIHSPEGYLISYVDAEGQLTGLFVKHDAVQIPQNFTRTGSSDLFNLGNLGDMSDFLGNIRDAGTLGADLFNAETYKFLNDLAGIGADGIIGLLPLPLKIPVLSLKEMLEGMTNSLYERQKKALYGDCNIKIEEISNDGKGNINVFVTIENANTIPSHLYHLYYNEPESVTRNTVYWGVVGKKGSVPYLNWYTKPYSYEALLDCSVSSSQYKMLTFEMPHDGDKWYFRAYLKSLRLKDSNNKVNDNHIKYSEKYEYNALDAYITDFEQTSQYKKEDDITFKCTVEGYINSLADVMEWGIYYLDDKANYTYFPSKYTIGYTPPEGMSSQPNTDKIDIEIKIKANSLVNGYKDIKLGVYTKGGYYLSYNGWSEPQIYSLKYSEALCNDEHHVHAVDLGLSVKWACCNVGASSPEE